MKLILFLALSVCAYADTVTITSSGAFYNAMLNSSTSIRMLCVEVNAPAPSSPYEATVSRFDNLSATRHPEQAQAFTAAAWLYDQMVLNMASPQNLFPIGALETHLRHRLGDPLLLRRALELHVATRR